MNNIMITVANVQQPAPGKQKGAIIDQTGKKWGVWPELLRTVLLGQTYIVNRFDTNEYMGRTYYTIKDITAVGNASAPMAPQTIPYSAVGSAGNTTGVPSPSRPVGMDDGQRRLDIFVCGAFNNILANPNTNPATLSMMDIVDTLHKLKSAWTAVFGPNPLPPRRRDDPISSGVKTYEPGPDGNFS